MMLETKTVVHCPICQAEIADPSVRKLCQNCGNGDRTRTAFLLYQALRPITKQAKALVFTAENWLPDDMFASCERSIFLGQNHLDIQDIARDDGSYSWIASNHVLEHVEDDQAALREMYRILTTDGVLQITVPTPAFTYSSTDWGYPDLDKMGHYRNYGADFAFFLRRVLPSACVLTAIAKDTISPYMDVVFFICKSALRMQEIAELLFAANMIAIPSLPVEPEPMVEGRRDLRRPTMEQSLRLVRHLAPDAVEQIVDIGAQRHTDFLMDAFPDRLHHLFEPVSIYHKDLEKNYRSRNIRYKLHKLALSNESGVLFLHNTSLDGSGNITHSQILPHRDETMEFLVNIEEIDVKRLDDVFTPKDVGGDLSYLIKIDVDGLEEEIIEGGADLIRSASFVIIEASIGQENFFARADLLKRYGFRMFDICDNAYYYGQLAQVDFLLINDRLRRDNMKFKPWQYAEGKVVWRKWQHGFRDLVGAPIDDPFKDDTKGG